MFSIMPPLTSDEDKVLTTLLTNPKSPITSILDHAEVLQMKTHDCFSDYFSPIRIKELIAIATQSTVPAKIKPNEAQEKQWPYLAAELLKVESIYEIVLAEMPSTKYTPTDTKFNVTVPNEKESWLLDMLFAALDNEKALKNPTQFGYFANTVIFFLNTKGATMIRYIDSKSRMNSILKYARIASIIEIIKCFFNCTLDNKLETDNAIRERGYEILLKFINSSKLSTDSTMFNNMATIVKYLIEIDMVDYPTVVKHIELILALMDPQYIMPCMCSIKLMSSFILKIKNVDLLPEKLKDQALYAKIASLLKSTLPIQSTICILKLFNNVFSVENIIINDKEILGAVGKSLLDCLKEGCTSSPLLTGWLQLLKSFAIPQNKGLLEYMFSKPLEEYLAGTNYNSMSTSAVFPLVCEIALVFKSLKKQRLIASIDPKVKQLCNRYLCDIERPLFYDAGNSEISKRDLVKIIYEEHKQSIMDDITVEDHLLDLEIDKL